MRRERWLLVLSFLVAALLPPGAHAWERGVVQRFAALPDGARNPEGITADRHGRVYVTTFDIAGGGSPGRMFVYGRHGGLEREVSIAGSSNLLLGLAFHPKHGVLLMIDFGNQQVLRVNPHNGESSLFAKIPGGAAAGPNALTFDRDGNVYISDSFQGVIWRTGPSGGAPVEWVKSDLLATSGVPPFGANGIAFNKAGTEMFVANTGNDQVIRIPVAGGVPGAPAVFVNSVNGADGLIVDHDDNLWICANQADEIVVLDPTGRVIAKLGDFGGLTRSGAPRGLLFPASLVRAGEWIYVTNLSLDLRAFGLPQPVDAQWAADVKRHTVSRLKARIPPVRGLP
jgi:sugar lactone lactonase YvrE